MSSRTQPAKSSAVAPRFTTSTHSQSSSDELGLYMISEITKLISSTSSTVTESAALSLSPAASVTVTVRS